MLWYSISILFFRKSIKHINKIFYKYFCFFLIFIAPKLK